MNHQRSQYPQYQYQQRRKSEWIKNLFLIFAILATIGILIFTLSSCDTTSLPQTSFPTATYTDLILTAQGATKTQKPSPPPDENKSNTDSQPISSEPDYQSTITILQVTITAKADEAKQTQSAIENEQQGAQLTLNAIEIQVAANQATQVAKGFEEQDQRKTQQAEYTSTVNPIATMNAIRLKNDIQSITQSRKRTETIKDSILILFEGLLIILLVLIAYFAYKAIKANSTRIEQEAKIPEIMSSREKTMRQQIIIYYNDRETLGRLITEIEKLNDAKIMEGNIIPGFRHLSGMNASNWDLAIKVLKRFGYVETSPSGTFYNNGSIQDLCDEVRAGTIPPSSLPQHIFNDSESTRVQPSVTNDGSYSITP